MADISLAYLDQPLSNVSVGYQNADFVASGVFPLVPVDTRSGRYWVFGFEKFREYDTARAPGAEAKEVAPWSLSNNPFYCDGHAMKDWIPDEQRAAASAGAQVEVTTIENLMQAILLKYEIRVQALVAGGTVPNATLAGTSQWSDYVNSDPISAIEAQKAVIEQAVGAIPNTLVVSYPVFLKLRQHPKILDRFKYTQTGILQPDHLKTAFDVSNFLVARAKRNTANEGQAPTLSYVWNKDALLAYAPPAPGQRIVSLGYTFRWLFGAPELGGILTKRYRQENRTADIIEVQTYYDIQVVAASAGFYWINASA